MKHRVIFLAVCLLFNLTSKASSQSDLFKIDMNKVEVLEVLNIDTIASLDIGDYGYANEYGFYFCNDNGVLGILTSTKISKKLDVHSSAYKVIKTSDSQIKIEIAEAEAAHNVPDSEYILLMLAGGRSCSERNKDGSSIMTVSSFFGANSLNDLYGVLEKKDSKVAQKQMLKMQELLSKYKSAAEDKPKQDSKIEKKGLKLAEKAINAYQVGDGDSWNKIVCGTSDNNGMSSWKNVNRSVGEISNVKLLKKGEKTNAGNSAGIAPDYVDASYEFLSSSYPLGIMLFNFSYHDETKCLYLLY